MARDGRPLVIAKAHDASGVRGDAALLRHALDVVLDNAFVCGAGTVRIDCRVDEDTV